MDNVGILRTRRSGVEKHGSISRPSKIEATSSWTGWRGRLAPSSALWQSAHRLRQRAEPAPRCSSIWSATVAGVTRPASRHAAFCWRLLANVAKRPRERPSPNKRCLRLPDATSRLATYTALRTVNYPHFAAAQWALIRRAAVLAQGGIACRRIGADTTFAMQMRTTNLKVLRWALPRLHRGPRRRPRQVRSDTRAGP